MSSFQSLVEWPNEYDCSIGRKQNHEMLRIYNGERTFTGLHCIHCGLEVLLKDFHPVVDETCKPMKWEHYTLYELKHSYEVHTAFQIEPNKTLIESREKMEEHLKPGDVVVFERYNEIYWHFAVVEDANGVNVKLIEVVSEKKGKKSLPGVRRKEIDVSKPGHESTCMYRLNFDEDVLKKNPTWLVLGRAEAALRVPRSAQSQFCFHKYQLFMKNCEMFANYCKLGVRASRQVPHGARKLVEVLCGDSMACAGRAVAVKLSKSVGVSVLKSARIATAANVLAPVIVIVVEGASCVADVIDLFKERQKGNLVWKQFCSEVAKRVMEAGVGAAGCAWTCILGAVLSLIPGVGLTAVLATTAVLGVVGAIGGRFGGNMAGVAVAKSITAGMKHEHDEEFIPDPCKLQQGDHVVMMSCFHRHHVIVLDTTETRLRVIHRRHQRGGVREEWLDVGLSGIYRVLWPEKERRPTQEIIQRAKARVGEKIYDVYINKCERFAVECIQATY